jgi:DMSO/TMAO reductase YedYZ molybdopterin-dependent catalytic subunit
MSIAAWKKNYVYRIELTNAPVTGYWEKYGYSYEGDVPADRLKLR